MNYRRNLLILPLVALSIKSIASGDPFIFTLQEEASSLTNTLDKGPLSEGEKIIDAISNKTFTLFAKSPQNFSTESNDDIEILYLSEDVEKNPQYLEVKQYTVSKVIKSITPINGIAAFEARKTSLEAKENSDKNICVTLYGLPYRIDKINTQGDHIYGKYKRNHSWFKDHVITQNALKKATPSQRAVFDNVDDYEWRPDNLKYAAKIGISGLATVMLGYFLIKTIF